MNKPVLAKSKAITIFLVFALGYFISNLLRAITATISPELVNEFNLTEDQKDNLLSVEVDKVEDLGNFKLLTAKMGELTIKSKINRETEVPSSDVKLHIPADKCCVYENEILI